jgi:hypothetical protein
MPVAMKPYTWSLCALLLWSCASKPPQVERPRGNLEALNSAAREFAPAFRPGNPDLLYFTSDRAGSEDVWRARVQLSPTGVVVLEPPAPDNSEFRRWLTSWGANEGTIAFLSPTEAIAAALRTPEVEQALALSGGMDLLGLLFADGQWYAFPLGDSLNSAAWDAHPTVGVRGDSVLLIFASDRPVDTPAPHRGWSFPFRNAVRVLPSGDTLRGNADLYYAWRINGHWSPARNLAEVPGGELLNTTAQEYFPFLFCIEHRPRLLFVSDRAGDYDIYLAELRVDFAHRSLEVLQVQPLPKGEDSLNSFFAELSPAIPPPHPSADSVRLLLFSSDRDTLARKLSEGRVRKNVGALDLYALPIVLECRPPRITYELVVLDRTDPRRPVLHPFLELRDASGQTITTSTTGRLRAELQPGRLYTAFGGSRHSSPECVAPEPVIIGYTGLVEGQELLSLHHPIPSELSQQGGFRIPTPTADTLVRDTLWLTPQWYTPPQCRWIFSERLADPLRRSVPYYQTAFWEVNTSANLQRHLSLLRSARYRDAGFIELHPSNQYWGYLWLEDPAQRERRRLRYERRVQQYAEFARTVDANLRLLADSITRIILPRFLEYARHRPAAKLIITLAAYSDIRPIVRGEYLGTDTVCYIGGHYDSLAAGFRVQLVCVPPGASLVGADNDTLSKLRAYYGYRELLGLLLRDTLMQRLRQSGQLLLPTDTRSVEEFARRAADASVIVLAEGRYYDPQVRPQLAGYYGREGDYYELDTVRRLDVFVELVERQGALYYRPPCCLP